jgi:1,4-alpha-glucan branching enzyme
MELTQGSLVFVFHSHIPYCRKSGMWPFGEEWLYEAMLGSYIPFLDVLRSIPSRQDESERYGSSSELPISVTIGVTPILLEQLDDDYMREGFIKWAQARIKRAEEDRKRFKLTGDKVLEDLAGSYCDEYRQALRTFRHDYASDIVSALAELERRGVVEIITSAATHGYLPLLNEDTSIRAQLAVGCETHEMRFGRPSRGIWLPECAYRPGLEEFLETFGLEYFFVDRHAIEGGDPIDVSSGAEDGEARSGFAVFGGGVRGTTYKPYLVNRSNIVCMGRNERVTTQVWSSWLGYPGDGLYREFHRKDDVTGLQYWRVTGREVELGNKEVYNREKAVLRAKEHAAHFVGLACELVNNWNATTGEHGAIVAPYDMELFGHWWYEGVFWLSEIFSELMENSTVGVCSAGEFLNHHPPSETIKLPESSWGRGGRHEVWLNDETAWMWDMIHAAESRIKRLAALSPATEDTGLLELLKTQALREFLLLTSSDWPFLVTERQAEDYGSKRFREHAERFDRLMDYAESILDGEGSLASEEEITGYLSYVRELDNPFPNLRFSALGSQEQDNPEKEDAEQV